MSQEEAVPEEAPPTAQTQTQSTLSPSEVQSQPQSKSSSSGSSGSSGTMSSVDTIPMTLPSVPEEPEPEPQPWGRLLPLLPGFRAHDCVLDSYVFGRESTSDYILGDGSRKFLIYSKRHFRIYKEGSEVFVQNFSNSGTFIDGVKIKKDRTAPLTNNAEISLSQVKNRVFVFTDLMSSEQSALPKSLEEKYALTRRIGTGVCGEVRLAIERETCRRYAVKIINKGNFKSEGTATRNAETEIEILRRIDHPCLMKTVDFYQTEDSYYIVLELMEGGELFFRIKSKKQLQENITKLYFYQTLLAVQYLHRNGIIHRDIKPENVLLSSTEDECLIKVTDFNQSRILEEAALMRTLCGTPKYLAPEVFASTSTSGYGLSVDAWSLGVLLFVCLGGYPPFHESDDGTSVREQILRGQYTLHESKWGHISDQAVDMVRKLLVVDVSQRMTIEEALAHPWLQDEEMKSTAQRLMYPSNVSSSSAAAAMVKEEVPLSRKRPRPDENDKSERPTKRCQ